MESKWKGERKGGGGGGVRGEFVFFSFPPYLIQLSSLFLVVAMINIQTLALTQEEEE
jgi:hypothetical protein